MDDGRATRVVVVEDEAITAMLMKINLHGMGMTVVDTCATGEDAVRVVLETTPDIVLMDINLAGEIDGIEAARRIGDEASTPIIFVTGYSDKEHHDRARELNPAGFLVKPVVFPELERLIRDSIRT
jgi:two-component system, response regulator PdtaR